jgi:hypothetical protein
LNCERHKKRRKGGQNWGEENILKYDILNLLEAITQITSFKIKRDFFFERGATGKCFAIHK